MAVVGRGGGQRQKRGATAAAAGHTAATKAAAAGGGGGTTAGTVAAPRVPTPAPTRGRLCTQSVRPPYTSRQAHTSTPHIGARRRGRRPAAGRAHAGARRTPIAPEAVWGSSTAARQRGGAAAQLPTAALLQLLLPLRRSSAAKPWLHLRTRAATPEAVGAIALGLGTGRQASPRCTRARIAACVWLLCHTRARCSARCERAGGGGERT